MQRFGEAPCTGVEYLQRGASYEFLPSALACIGLHWRLLLFELRFHGKKSVNTAVTLMQRVTHVNPPDGW
jgi:hypothetical protein